MSRGPWPAPKRLRTRPPSRAPSRRVRRRSGSEEERHSPATRWPHDGEDGKKNKETRLFPRCFPSFLLYSFSLFSLFLPRPEQRRSLESRVQMWQNDASSAMAPQRSTGPLLRRFFRGPLCGAQVRPRLGKMHRKHSSTEPSPQKAFFLGVSPRLPQPSIAWTFLLCSLQDGAATVTAGETQMSPLR